MAAEGWLGVTCTPASGTNILESHQYDVTVNFQIGFNYGGKNGYGASYSITCDGQTQNGTATFSVPSANGQGMKWANIGTKTFRVTLDKSGQAKTISISFRLERIITYLNGISITLVPVPHTHWMRLRGNGL